MIALIGGAGSIGRRYQAILRYLGQDFIVVEQDDLPEPDLWSRAIICTPTTTHYEVAEFCKSEDIPFLLEKPPTTNLEEALLMALWELDGAKGYIVNNYAFLDTNVWFPKRIKHISYDFYNTGKDGLTWDLCQLIYLAKLSGASITGKANLPEWTLYVNDERIPYDAIEASYIQMIRAFLNDEKHRLWTLRHAPGIVKAVNAVDSTIPTYFHHEFEESKP